MVSKKEGRKLLVVVDMQNDFISGSLGTKEAEAIVPKVADKIRNWEGDAVLTLDTHDRFYLETNEGKHLPVEHCIKGTAGYELDPRIIEAATIHEQRRGYSTLVIEKHAFGCVDLVRQIQAKWGLRAYCEIQLVGLYTDICVVSNAIILKSQFPETPIFVDASCCAGSTPEHHLLALELMRKNHLLALELMRKNHIDALNE